MWSLWFFSPSAYTAASVICVQEAKRVYVGTLISPSKAQMCEGLPPVGQSSTARLRPAVEQQRATVPQMPSTSVPPTLLFFLPACAARPVPTLHCYIPYIVLPGVGYMGMELD